MTTIETRTPRFANPGPEEIRDMFSRIKTIAVVGLSPNPRRPSFRVASALQRSGFRIVPVRPLVDEVLGEKAWPNLAELPQPVDLVNVFRSAEHLDALVDDCVRLSVRRLWIQQGIVNENAAVRATAHGIWTVMDRCIQTDLSTLCEPAPRLG
ncbi:MAG: CoA-binding protein [Betaproteobacteria bacterium]